MIKGRDFWNSISGEYNSGRTKGRQFILDPAIVKILGNVKDKRILDVGCGDGALILQLAQKGALCTGIDFSEKLIDIACAKAKRLKLNANFKVADAREFKDFKEKFDIVLITLLLPHLNSIADMNKVMVNIHKALTKNGRLLIGEPHPAFDFYMREKLKTDDFNYFKSGLSYRFEMKIHGKVLASEAYHWTLEDYTFALSNNGFSINKIVEPQPSPDAKDIDPAWFDQRNRYPSYMILDCEKVA